MQELVRTHDIEKKAATSAQHKSRQPQNPMHDFCCRKELVLCVDNSGDEFAVFTDQIHADKTKGVTRTYQQIRVADTVYRLRVP